MLFSGTPISVISPDGTNIRCCIEELYRNFLLCDSVSAIGAIVGVFRMVPVNDNWMIQEVFGWTKIQSINLRGVPRDEWFTIRAGDKMIHAHKTALIPIYTGGCQIGYQGMRKYTYTNIPVTDLTTGDLVRKPDVETEFIPIDSVEPTTFKSCDTQAYTITTKAGCYNAAGIVVYGGNLVAPVLKGMN